MPNDCHLDEELMERIFSDGPHEATIRTED